MQTTPNFGIAYPTGPDDVTPLQATLATMASSVDNALMGIAGQTPMLPVANTTERDSIYPSPVQGDSVFRIDKGWMEVYYAAYSASANPGGTIVAGWYPVFGKLPRITMMRTGEDQSIAGDNAHHKLAYNSVSDTVGTAFSADTNEGRVTATLGGRYRVTVNNMIDTSDTGYVDTIIKRGGNVDLAWYTGSIGNAVWWTQSNMDAEVLLSASQYVEIYLGSDAVHLLLKARGAAGSYYSVQYVSPPFPNNS
jgi:hypothetical protein